MNKLETNIGEPIANSSPETKMEDIKFEELKADLLQKENTELFSVSTEKPQSSRFKKAIHAITAGAMLLCATPAFSQEKGEQLTEGQKIELQIQELQKQKMQLDREQNESRQEERYRELNSYLKFFNISGLELGKVKSQIRCPCEQLGVYLDGKHLGDIYSNDSFTFSHREYIQDVSEILHKHKLRTDSQLHTDADTVVFMDNVAKLSQSEQVEKFNFQIDVAPEAQELLKKWGGGVKGNIIDIGNPEKPLEIDNKTKEVKLISPSSDMLIIIVEDYDGIKTIVTCTDKDILSIKETK